jgi:hypothetical protein
MKPRLVSSLPPATEPQLDEEICLLLIQRRQAI